MLENEPLITPEAAWAFLSRRSDVVEFHGKLIFTESVPHLGMAALLIANGAESGYVSEVYHTQFMHRGPLSDEVMLRFAEDVASCETLDE